MSLVEFDIVLLVLLVAVSFYIELLRAAISIVQMPFVEYLLQIQKLVQQIWLEQIYSIFLIELN